MLASGAMTGNQKVKEGARPGMSPAISSSSLQGFYPRREYCERKEGVLPGEDGGLRKGAKKANSAKVPASGRMSSGSVEQSRGDSESDPKKKSPQREGDNLLR